jgi:hypothetical protein
MNLSLFGSASEQDDKFVTLLSKIDPVARTEIYLIFRYAFSNGLNVR